MKQTARKPPAQVSTGGLIGPVSLGVLFLSLSIQKLWSPDIWWELRTGKWILEHAALPTRDTLSFTVPDHEWIEMPWLFFVAADLLWRVGGPALLILGQTALLACTYFAIVWPVRRVAATTPGLIIVGLGIFSASARFHVRPEVVTFVSLSVFLAVLPEYARGRFPRLVWVLPALQVVWTNAHPASMLGPIVAWLFTAAEFLRRLLSREGRYWEGSGRMALVALVVTAACWLNPYGQRGAMFPLQVLGELQKTTITGRFIEEFQSPFEIQRWSFEMYTAAVLVVITALTFISRWGIGQLPLLLVWGAFVYLGATSVRNVALLALVSTWASLRNLAAIPTGRHERSAPRPLPRWIFASLALLTSWLIVTDRYAVGEGLPWRFGLGVIERRTPAEAVEFILKAGARPQVFHSMTDGSYLTWAGAGRFPVFVDGRLEVYGEAFLKKYVDLLLNGRQWEGFADADGINTAILETEHVGGFVGAVNSSRHWVLVHIDAEDLVYVRDIPEHAGLIQKYRIDPMQPWVAREAEPDEMPSGWRRAIGSVAEPWYEFGMARNFLLLGSVANASRFVDRGLARSPRHPGLLHLKDVIARVESRRMRM